LSKRPIPGTRHARAQHGAGRSMVPYLALHPMGFSVPPRLLLERWALTPPFHPYLDQRCRRSRRFQFLRHFPSERLAALPPACIPGSGQGYAASRPVVFGLSSPGLSLPAEGDPPPFPTREEPIPPPSPWQAQPPLGQQPQNRRDPGHTDQPHSPTSSQKKSRIAPAQW
jgi:hypothetical protein